MHNTFSPSGGRLYYKFNRRRYGERHSGVTQHFGKSLVVCRNLGNFLINKQ